MLIRSPLLNLNVGRAARLRSGCVRRVKVLLITVTCCVGITGSVDAQLVPNDNSIAGNLLVWLTDPAGTYDEQAGIWLDSSGNENSAEIFVGAKAGLEFEPFLLESESVEFGLLAGQDVDYVLSTEADDSLRTPPLNDGLGFEEFTIITAFRYGDTASNNRPVGLGSFHDDDLRPGLQLAGDGSIRKDNGFLAGSAPIPEDFFIRASILTADDGEALLTDVYFDDVGPLINIDEVPFDGGNVTADDRVYLGDLRAPFMDNAVAQVLVYNAALTLGQVTSVAEWMTENPNGVAVPEGFLLGDFDGNEVVDFADFLIMAGNFNGPGEFAQGDMDFNGKINLRDFGLFRSIFNAPVGAASVPEPSTGLMVILGSLVAFMVRRRH